MGTFKTRAVTFFSATVALALPAMPASAEYLKPRVDPARPHGAPAYPAQAQANGEQGTVKLSLKINSAGHVRWVKVIGSSGYPDLDNAASESAITWHYLPASQNGETFTDEMSLDVKYELPPQQQQVQSPPGTQAAR